jgi:hypothetical protein
MVAEEVSSGAPISTRQDKWVSVSVRGVGVRERMSGLELVG